MARRQEQQLTFHQSSQLLKKDVRQSLLSFHHIHPKINTFLYENHLIASQHR